MNEHGLGFRSIQTRVVVAEPFVGKMNSQGEGLSDRGHILSNGVDGSVISEKKCGSTSDGFR